MGRKADPVITSFSRLVKKHFAPCRIILFGSQAKRTARADSDYDFLLISPRFQKLEWEKRSAEVYLLKQNIPCAMDIICLTPEEFEERKGKLGIVQEAFKKGIEIAL